MDYKSRISYCAPCLGERYSVSRVSRELYERLTACANRYLSFEADFLMRTDAKSVSLPPTHPPEKLFILSSICTSMHNYIWKQK